MTLRELLKQDELRVVEVVAGADGLERTISGTVMFDNPEMVNWMRAGEIMLTAGYFLLDDPAKQENVLRETGNLEDAIPALFDYFQGEMVSYNQWAGPDTHFKKNYGEYWKSYDCTYDFETTQDKYRLAMEYITVDTADKDNVEIRSLYIIRFADDTDQERAYRRDGNDTLGINIGKS